ncbi:hypothetical protein GCM10007425_00010 [Lysinibacillus alkalisoli]|uniref:HTH LytTR-type domain-containing protein n=1 Tax=Lysinibacillus alkalisoli TaxID=1911548 RepID=A0A917FWV7_9BACI|nr:LytTR family DNA-binding domain-containing protein [Lysinibacillus alkalisoli]GGG09698.1 hypothetical protein GCM10007425_00010 [Lysinibacillus alkalisoli]
MIQTIETEVKKVVMQYQELLKDWLPTHSSIAIAQNDTYIYFSSTNENFQLSVGTPVLKESIAYRVLQKNSKIDAMIDSTLFQQPYYGVGYPITLSNKPAALIIILPPSFQFPQVEPLSFLTGKNEEGWFPIALEDIMYIESLQKKTWFYCKSEQLTTTITLKELQLRLPSYFIRIHRSYIVNILFIKNISRDMSSSFQLILKDGTTLPISQSYISEVREILSF